MKLEMLKDRFSCSAVLGLTTILFFVSLFVSVGISAPKDFPVNTAVTIEEGSTVSETVTSFKEQNLVRSEFLFYIIMVGFHRPESLKAGTYVFENPLSAITLAGRITEQAPPDTLISVTFPEGYSAKEYAQIASLHLIDFDSGEFYELAKDSEGYLFPETYFVPADFTPEKLFDLLTKTYKEKTAAFNEQISKNSLSSYEIVTLASIIEREANDDESMQLVANILLQRLDLGMPLQVDASMEYILEKPLKELTADDLKIDTPYNTYLYTGLTPTPIGNPGLVSIAAVLNAVPTEYLYYITDEEGEFHYAKTYAEHLRNIEKYLK